MNKKTGIAVFAAAALLTSSVAPSLSFAAEKVESTQVQEALSIEDLNTNYQVSDVNTDGLVRTVTYENGNDQHTVVYNGLNGSVTIDTQVQEDLVYEYDTTKENTVNNASTTQGTFTTMAAKPKSGYKYVGTLSGHTKEAKNAADLAGKLSLVIPGLGWGAKVAIILSGYAINQKVPAAYYTYDLYEKGAMTTNWYQYSTTRLYKDKAHKKPMGKAWTSSPQHIYLPNS
ncbi:MULTISPECIES: hypothetical protein [Priestia]|uniref:hypothetical protein n=2 Tax=Priestia megaterium TaxID=1404 RepID=UPI0012B7CEA4|nr:hypothetical protein [Priestia megaterium]